MATRVVGILNGAFIGAPNMQRTRGGALTGRTKAPVAPSMRVGLSIE